jgi:phosphotriesterase-related protein
MESKPMSDRAFIRTVLGDIEPRLLGDCYAHEHLIIDPSYTTEKTPDFLLDDVEKCVAELREAYGAGARAMVDSMPMACGRNVSKLAAVSRATGMHVLCPTGLHLRKHYPSWHWSVRLGEEALAQLFIREINQGIDANDGNGPEWKDSGCRAGLIKIAAGLNAIDDHERKVFTAAAMAHRATGAPILTHCEAGTAALQQIDLLQSLGVDVRHVVLSHIDRVADAGYHREILGSGARVEYDRAFASDNVLTLLQAILEDFPEQIMLGMDAARRGYWKQYGGKPGMAFLVTTFVAAMRKVGISAEMIRRIFVTTPAFTYSFARAA